MYARIAHFEGGNVDRIDEDLAEMRSQMEEMRAGGLPAGAPEGAKVLGETVARFLQLVDRESGKSIGITFCETEEDMRRADEALNEMSPPDDAGKRTSVGIYEVGLDESFR